MASRSRTGSDPSAGARLLVVDDDEPLRQLLVDLLESAGYRVLSAGHADGALALLAEEGVDVLVTDRALGLGMNGEALARSARERDPELPVLFVSGSLDPSDARPEALGERDRFLHKPFSRARLLEAVELLLRLRAG
jgi:DNA-binding NtrC family response regulator